MLHDTGAYGASMSSNYNARPLIAEVLMENGEPGLFDEGRRWSVETMRHQGIPSEAQALWRHGRRAGVDAGGRVIDVGWCRASNSSGRASMSCSRPPVFIAITSPTP